MQQKENTEAKSFATISYVSLPYSDIVDSTIAVTDADVNDYVSKHKDMFKQEEGRNISYVSFSQLPNGEDSTRTGTFIAGLKNAFAADSTPRAFVTKNTSTIEYSDDYAPKSK